MILGNGFTIAMQRHCLRSPHGHIMFHDIKICDKCYYKMSNLNNELIMTLPFAFFLRNYSELNIKCQKMQLKE